MMKKSKKKIMGLMVLALVASVISPCNIALAADTEVGAKYYVGELTNAGKDTGYSESNVIGEKDPHYGWSLGKFFISDYTRVITDGDDPVFLKTVGDKVTLSFNLEQSIDLLNGDATLSIADIDKGYNTEFAIPEMDFGQGTLIIQHTNYQNYTADPVVYTDYLPALAVDADTEVEFLEEGDYQVTFNYKVKNDPRNVLGVSILPSYTDYKIDFSFSVRNGNCMVFPFDNVTGEELLNTSITENGFYLDLANSRYLDIDIKKEVLQTGAEGLTEDTRFNKPAKDGDAYTDEGIYTITVSNRYTNQETVKKIYVGTNEILKAVVTTGLTLTDVKNQIAEGYTIAADGTFVAPVVVLEEPVETVIEEEPIVEEVVNILEEEPTEDVIEEPTSANNIPLFVGGGAVLLALIFFVIKKKNRKEMDLTEKGDE